MKPVRVVLADDHALFRSSARRHLGRDGIAVIGEAVSGEEALSRIADLDPDVAVVDIFMSPMDGLAVTERLVEATSRTSVVMITGASEEEALRARALAAGATDLVHKSAPPKDLITAIRDAADKQRGLCARARGGIGALSTRELEVLALFAEGYGRVQIGAHLGLSPRTVDTHRASLLRKLGVTSIAEAARIAERTGVVARPR